jgi:hypothetical protein
MVFVVGLALIMVTALAVCVPLFRGDVEDAGDVAIDAGRERWEKQKREAYAAIKDAEMDHAMGKLAAADYEHLRAVQEGRALDALRALEPSAVANPRPTRRSGGGGE